MSSELQGKQQKEEVEPFSPCIYFLTQRHLYVAVFRWQEVRTQFGQVRPREEWKVEFISPLIEVPLVGEDIFYLIENVATEGRDLLFIPERYDNAGHMGRPSRTNPMNDLDIHKIVLIRPSHTTKAIEELIRVTGWTWYEQAANQNWFHEQLPPPIPSDEAQTNEQGEPLFDLYTVSKEARIIQKDGDFVRVTWAQALQIARSIIDNKRPDDIILRYFEEDATVQWINAVYTDVGPIPTFGYTPVNPV